jgi:hypothetical protein
MSLQQERKLYARKRGSKKMLRVPYLRGPVSGERTAERLTLFLRALNRPPCLPLLHSVSPWFSLFLFLFSGLVSNNQHGILILDERKQATYFI